jgi:hypothetical protein
MAKKAQIEEESCRLRKEGRQRKRLSEKGGQVPSPKKAREVEAPPADETPNAEELYPWMVECNAFLAEHDGVSIQSVDDPRIYVIDQYLKQCMDGLVSTQVAGMRFLIDQVCGGSPLQALYSVAVDKQEHGDRDPVLAVIVERLREDLELKDQFRNGHGAVKIRAAAMLRQRGLMK